MQDRNIHLLITGNFLGVVALVLPKIDLMQFSLSIYNVSISAVVLLFFLRFRFSALDQGWHLLLGIALFGVPQMIIADALPRFTVGLLGAGISITFIALMSISKFKLSDYFHDLMRDAPKLLWFSTFAIIVTFIFYRISFEFSQHIPNEERSVFIFGFEIHHINFGLLGLLVLMLVSFGRNTRGRVLFLIILGVSLGSMSDQLAYNLLSDMSDQAYGEAISLFGGIIGTIFVAVSAPGIVYPVILRATSSIK